jgi:alpha-beta hydrolase superfamily lysophospholipase
VHDSSPSLTLPREVSGKDDGRRRSFARAGALAGALFVLACAPVYRLPGPDAAKPSLTPGGFVAFDGAVLPARAWMPKSEEPSAVIVALHGFNDYGNFFAQPGRYLARLGFGVYAYDQRGFGQAPNRGYWPGVEALQRDLAAVVRAVKARHPGLPVYLLGESMGGAVVMTTLAGPDPPEIDGAILSAPAVWARFTMPWYQRAVLWVGAHSLPWLTVTGRGLGIKPSDNVEMLRALGRDPLVIKETRIDALHGLADLMDAALDAAPAFSAPALILYGAHDEIIPRSPTRLMVERLPREGGARRRLAVYENGYHMLLRDLQAETLWLDVAHWLTDPASPLPSGADGRGARLLAQE